MKKEIATIFRHILLATKSIMPTDTTNPSLTNSQPKFYYFNFSSIHVLKPSDGSNVTRRSHRCTQTRHRKCTLENCACTSRSTHFHWHWNYYSLRWPFGSNAIKYVKCDFKLSICIHLFIIYLSLNRFMFVLGFGGYWSLVYAMSFSTWLLYVTWLDALSPKMVTLLAVYVCFNVAPQLLNRS